MAYPQQQRASALVISVAERRQFCTALRKAGATFQEIADAAVVHFGAENLPKSWCARMAHRDVKMVIEQLRTQMTQDVIEMRIMQTERLEALIKASWEKAVKGNLGAQDRVHKFIRTECDIWGLFAPQQVDMRVGDLDAAIDRELAELAALRKAAVSRSLAGAEDGIEAAPMALPATTA